MVKFFKRRKLFDEDADWVPQKGRAFKMKGTTQKEEPPREEPPKEEGPEVPFRMKAEPPNIKYDLPKKEPKHEPEKKQDKIKTDAEGMDRAYAQGDVYGEDNKMYVAGSHTGRDWLDDVTKIPQWQKVPSGFVDFIDLLNSAPGRLIFGTGDIRQSERYQKARDYLVAHPEVNFLDGHSLGGSVVLQLQKDFPERNLKTFTQGAPVWDLLGRQKREEGQENVMRVSNNGDIVSMFDRSAKKTQHPNPGNFAPSFWHDYHNKEQAGGTLEGERLPGSDKPGGADANYRGNFGATPGLDNTVKTTWDTHPFHPFNQNLIYDKTDGDKMTE